MSKCSLAGECAFYNKKIVNMVKISEYIKELYCLQKAEKCKRLENYGSTGISDQSNGTTPWGIDCIRR